MIDAAQLTAILSYIMDYHRGWDICTKCKAAKQEVPTG